MFLSIDLFNDRNMHFSLDFENRFVKFTALVMLDFVADAIQMCVFM